MDRRSFLRSMVGGLAAAAAVRTFPFRVFSFPKEIVLPRGWLTVRDARALESDDGLLDDAAGINAWMQIHSSDLLYFKLYEGRDWTKAGDVPLGSFRICPALRDP